MKYCQKCGQQLEDSINFCTNCGATQTASAPVYVQSAAPVADPAAAESANKAMVLGIVAAATSGFGIPGIILAAISGKEIAKAEGLGASGGKLKAAKICRKVGLILGIIMTVFWVIYIIAIIALVANGAYLY